MDDKFTTLLKRLEAVTSRLETMEVAPPTAAGGAVEEDEGVRMMPPHEPHLARGHAGVPATFRRAAGVADGSGVR